MIIVAIIGDIFSVIPILNVVTGFFAPIVMGIVGAESGINIYAEDEIFATLVTTGIEMIPILSIFPTFTVRAILAKRSKKRKDEAAAAEQQSEQEQARAEAQKTQ